jgi:hypothetical protein
MYLFLFNDLVCSSDWTYSGGRHTQQRILRKEYMKIIIRVTRPCRSQQNAQWIWSSPLR